MNLKSFLSILFLSVSALIFAQEKSIVSGKITSSKEGVPFAFVYVKGGIEGTTADEKGNYQLQVPSGEITIEVSSQGYRKASKVITVKSGETITLNFELFEDLLGLDEVVVSATRNRVEKRNAPVVVSTLKPRLLTATQSISMAD